MTLSKKIKSNKPLMFLVGGSVLVCGIALVLQWWPDVAVLFRGMAGIILSLTGMLILAMIRD